MIEIDSDSKPLFIAETQAVSTTATPLPYRSPYPTVSHQSFLHTGHSQVFPVSPSFLTNWLNVTLGGGLGIWFNPLIGSRCQLYLYHTIYIAPLESTSETLCMHDYVRLNITQILV